ncbi:MAG: regulatory protein RecX [Eubacteriales bacterium]|nr:regulatory protein RecX [Eubacteriales bacterium]
MDINDVALRFLERRNRTKKEMKDHLAEKGFSKDDIGQCISYLENSCYLDDQRYCGEYLRYSFAKGWGKKKIAANLARLGISGEEIEEASRSYEEENGVDLSEEEIKRALRQAEKLAAASAKEDNFPAKLGRKLAYLGYDTETVYRVVGKYMK